MRKHVQYNVWGDGGGLGLKQKVINTCKNNLKLSNLWHFNEFSCWKSLGPSCLRKIIGVLCMGGDLSDR